MVIPPNIDQLNHHRQDIAGYLKNIAGYCWVPEKNIAGSLKDPQKIVAADFPHCGCTVEPVGDVRLLLKATVGGCSPSVEVSING